MSHIYLINSLVPITTKGLVRIPPMTRCASIQYYVIKFISWFSPVSATNKTDPHDITKILLKVTFNTITLTLTPINSYLIDCGFFCRSIFNLIIFLTRNELVIYYKRLGKALRHYGYDKSLYN